MNHQVAALLSMLLICSGCGDSEGAADGSGGSGGDNGGAGGAGAGGAGGMPTHTCVAAGTGNMVGDQIADFSFQTCDGTPVSLHDWCGVGKALYVVVGVDPWCTPCINSAMSAVAQFEARQAQGLAFGMTLSEDATLTPATEQTCLDYSTIGIGVSNLYIDPMHAGFSSNVDTTDDMGESPIPVHLIFRTDSMTLVAKLIGNDMEQEVAAALDQALQP